MTPDYIIVHCSATPDRGVLDWSAIRRYHVEHNGWRDIGYHFGIEEVDGSIMLLRGRRYDETGAHCVDGGMNHMSLGICVVGQFENYVPMHIEENLTKVLAELCFYFDIPVDHIYFHRDFHPTKTCPGQAWNRERLRENVESLLSIINGEEHGIELERNWNGGFDHV